LPSPQQKSHTFPDPSPSQKPVIHLTVRNLTEFSTAKQGVI